MWQSRFRLGALWVSQFARVVADWIVRVVAVLYIASDGRRDIAGAWYLATAVFIAPFIVLAPLNGMLNNGLPRRWVLSGSALYSLGVVGVFAVLQSHWLVCLGLIALGAAVYSPSRYAVLPAASVDTKIRLPRINGWMEMGSASAIVLGVYLGWLVAGSRAGSDQLPSNALGLLLGLNAVSFVTALFVAFPSDAPRPESVGQAVRGFFADVKRVIDHRRALGFVLGLAAFQALITAGSGALLAVALRGEGLGGGELLPALLFIGVGAAIGCFVASLQSNPWRSPGLVPYGATALPLVLLWAMFSVDSGALPRVPCLLLGFLGGFVNVPLRAAYEAAVPVDARGNAMAVMNFAIYILTSLLALTLFGLGEVGVLASGFGQLGVLAGLAFVGFLIAWRTLYVPAIEQALEVMLAPMYRFHLHGPGKMTMPLDGPLLIVANHSAYADPFWIAKQVPRHVTPMMTSVFYDIPGIRWMMVNVVNAIRVQEATFRREAPELDEAIRRLKEGQTCILVFPEARLRRTADQYIRPFGQGVWRILQAVPETRVVTCWIEGGWGSFFSYFDGLPFKNKWLDFLRRIDIVINEPQRIPEDELADRDATRTNLQRQVVELRAVLGLPVPNEEGFIEESGSDTPESDASVSSHRNDMPNSSAS